MQPHRWADGGIPDTASLALGCPWLFAGMVASSPRPEPRALLREARHASWPLGHRSPKKHGVGPGPAFGLGLEGGGRGSPLPTAPEPTAQQRTDTKWRSLIVLHCQRLAGCPRTGIERPAICRGARTVETVIVESPTTRGLRRFHFTAIVQRKGGPLQSIHLFPTACARVVAPRAYNGELLAAGVP